MGMIKHYVFRKRADVSDTALLEAAAATMAWFTERPGFAYRTLTREPDGLWHDMAFWRDAEAAAASDAAFFSHAPNAAYVALVDPESLSRSLLPELLSALPRDLEAA
ncbi:hypothetical protein [Paroceanicella profunda]|uniref:hypothetical protein n=1 Tax=Paroceanicella profunda TaxID=2579971 RepID=UPI001EF0FD7C|nr:hypothetical protein [Paroceanicella profunda]